MRKRKGLIPLLVIAALLLAFPVAAAATVPGHGVAADVYAADGPAVEAPPAEADEAEQPWTARFLAPAVLLLGVAALAGSILFYGVRIRGKYRVTS